MFLVEAWDFPVFSSPASCIPDIKESETNLGKSTNSLNGRRCLRHSLACDMLRIVTSCTVHYWFGKQRITMEASRLASWNCAWTCVYRPGCCHREIIHQWESLCSHLVTSFNLVLLFPQATGVLFQPLGTVTAEYQLECCTWATDTPMVSKHTFTHLKRFNIGN